MSKLTVFRRQASVDTCVTLRLTRGENISGRIAELDDSHVCLTSAAVRPLPSSKTFLPGGKYMVETASMLRSRSQAEVDEW